MYNGRRHGLAQGRCWLCAGAAQACGLCAACRLDLPRRPALELARRIAGLEACRVPFAYAFPISRLVHAAKFERDMAALAVLSRLTCDEVSAHLRNCDYLLPVPLAPGRFVSRGYNQATAIARELERATGLAVNLGIARRTRGAVPQSSLAGPERAANVRNAFRIRRSVRGDAIVIVDDVVTTGATLAALAQALRRAGAARVEAIAVAETAR